MKCFREIIDYVLIVYKINIQIFILRNLKICHYKIFRNLVYDHNQIHQIYYSVRVDSLIYLVLQG